MWSLLGHKTGRNYLCDLCGFTSHSMGRLIHHARAHGVARIKPHFYFGTLYGQLQKPDPEDPLRFRRRSRGIPGSPKIESDIPDPTS